LNDETREMRMLFVRVVSEWVILLSLMLCARLFGIAAGAISKWLPVGESPEDIKSYLPVHPIRVFVTAVDIVLIIIAVIVPLLSGGRFVYRLFQKAKNATP
jgi:hypothetical protein